MAVSFAALLFRPDEVSDAALAHGVAVAVAGFDVPAPHVLVAPLAGLPGWAAAFYRSGAKRLGELDELDHACEAFGEELPPALAVRDAAAGEGHAAAVVYAIAYGDELVLDDAWRFDEEGWARRFVREGDEGPEAGREGPDGEEAEPLELDGGAAEEERALAPHRGSTFLSAELGAPVLPELVRALFLTERRVDARLVDPAPPAIEREARRLCEVLGRVPGRGAAPLPAVGGVAPPASLAAFARAYDWADPADPADLYRELAIGALDGTLRFLRPSELAAKGADPAFAPAAARGLYPFAALSGSALGAARGGGAMLALAADGARVALVGASGAAREAGPTFGELVAYLALGWTERDDVEEDLIQALMLRARVRCEAGR
jgi:hypothetical protein